MSSGAEMKIHIYLQYKGNENDPKKTAGLKQDPKIVK